MTTDVFHTWASALPEPFWLLSGEGEILAANAAAVKRMPFPKGGLGLHLYQLCPDEAAVAQCLRHWSRTRQLLPQSLSLGLAGAPAQAYHVEGGRLNAAPTPEAVRMLVRIQTKDKGVSHFSRLNKDLNMVTKELHERRIVAAQLQRSVADAEAANRAKSQFLANMSHELRTPLNAVIGYSEMLQEEAEETGYQALLPDIKKIHSAGRQLLDLVNDVLDLSKIEAGKMELQMQSFVVADLLEEIVATVQPMVEKRGNVLLVEQDPSLGQMYADPVRVRQCLLNLLSNAAKFTERGSITLRALREPINDHEGLRFDVEDTGIGIDPKQLSRVFETFTQAHATLDPRFGGTGLGLAISRRFSHMMGGDITVRSTLGKGSVFTLHLPTSATETLPLPAPKVSLPTPSHQAMREVLVIDDDPDMRELLSRYLAREDIQVQTAANGAAGLALARKMRPTVIISDVLMPEMDGWELLTELQKDPKLAQIPVILVTMFDDQNLGYMLGAAHYLTKPVDRSQLLSLLDHYLPNGHSPTVMLVEDDEATRRPLRRKLEAEGWHVTEATNGVEGLELLAQDRPDLILLDLLMPEMDGFTFIETIRRHAAWASIPVVVLTAKDLTQAERRKLKGSVANIIEKDPQHKTQTLQMLLDEVNELTHWSANQG